MYQRSVDCFLGLPFNIASYALLTHLVAKTCDLKAKELVICMGDTHVYNNHLEQCMKLIQRKNDIKNMEFPKIDIKRKCNNLEDYCMEDIEIIGYKSLAAIKAEMAV